MKIIRKIIEIDEEKCDGCGNCVPACAEGAIQIIDGKAKVVKDQYCDGLGACLGDCPQGALTLVEREADEFDEEAVEAYLKSLESGQNSAASSKTLKTNTPTTDMPTAESTNGTVNSEKDDGKLGCGCPSSHLQTFIMDGSDTPSSAPGLHHRHGEGEPCACASANKPSQFQSVQSALGHWPVQIRLIPPTAPFLKGADLLVTADCVPVAYPAYHQDFLKGKVVMLGCPKFDDAESYIDKFAQIFKVAGIQSVTALIMEVPCCSGMPTILKKAMERAGVEIPIKQVVINGRGHIVSQ